MSRQEADELQALVSALHDHDAVECFLFVWGIVESWVHHRLHCLPFPAKLALVNTLTLPIVLLSAPVPRVPALEIAVMWIASYLLALMITMLLPLAPRRIHWLK